MKPDDVAGARENRRFQVVIEERPRHAGERGKRGGMTPEKAHPRESRRYRGASIGTTSK